MLSPSTSYLPGSSRTPAMVTLPPSSNVLLVVGVVMVSDGASLTIVMLRVTERLLPLPSSTVPVTAYVPSCGNVTSESLPVTSIDGGSVSTPHRSDPGGQGSGACQDTVSGSPSG